MKLLKTFFTLAVVALPQLALAFNFGATKPDNTPFSRPADILNTVFHLIITIAGVVFITMFFVGGMIYLTGAGNEEQTAKGRRMLIDATVGLVITLAAFAIANFVLRQLGVSVSL